MGTIEQNFNKIHQSKVNIHYHMPKLRELASQGDSVLELGFETGRSTWAFLASTAKVITSVDIQPKNPVAHIEAAKEAGKVFRFYNDDSLRFNPHVEYDLIFIDTLHRDWMITKELDRYQHWTKRIVMHDTNDFWEKRGGMKSAINKWLEKHPEWSKTYHTEECYGLTLIEKK